MTSEKPLPPSESASSPRVAPASPAPWSGHHRTTLAVLEDILERARTGDAITSTQERALADACELRGAAARGELPRHLLPNCVSKLATARFALNEIGAMSIAAYLSEAITPLRRARSRHRQELLLLRLQRNLNAVGPLLDGLIAKHAQSLLNARDRFRRVPSTARCARGTDTRSQ